MKYSLPEFEFFPGKKAVLNDFRMTHRIFCIQIIGGDEIEYIYITWVGKYSGELEWVMRNPHVINKGDLKIFCDEGIMIEFYGEIHVRNEKVKW